MLLAAAFFLIAAVNFFVPQKAYAAQGSLVFVETQCVVVETGEVLGASNNCDPGSSNCNDNDCSRFQTIASA